MNSTHVCVDASIAVAWLFDEAFSDNADELLRDWRKRGVGMLVPAVFHAEVASAIRRLVFSKQILPDEGEEAFSILSDIPVRTIDGPEVHRTAWRLASELSLPVCYDAQYLAVAELADCEVWTADQKLFNTLKGANKRINLVSRGVETKAPAKKVSEAWRPEHPDLPGLWRAM